MSTYRTPPVPGFVGAYNWRALALGLVLLFATNIAATYYVTHRFTPPFHWALLLVRYGDHPNPSLRLHILAGPMIIVIGSAVTVAAVYAMNLNRARKLSANSEDLHGSARWATRADIAETGLLHSPQGVYVGGWYDATERRVHYLRHDGPEHVLAFAPTRSGKGVGLVIPTLLAWSESAVIYDIKGENWAKTAGFRRSRGHLCLKFSPVEVGNGSRFNPLNEVRIGTERDVSDAQNVADMIVRTGEDSPQERYWQDAAASLTTGIVLHVCYAAAAEGRVASLADLVCAYTQPGQTFRETLEELENYPHDPAYKHKWQTRSGERTATHNVVREKIREMLDKEDKDFSGVLSTAKTALSVYSDPLVARNTSGSDFTINDLVNHERPVSVYLVVPPSDKIRLRPLMRLIFTMIVNRLSERMDFEGAARKANRYRLLFMIDEFPSLKRMEIFADALSYMAGYGLKAYLITQDIRQIVDEYGPNESIVSNCHVRVAYAPNQIDTAELLSKMTGTRTVQRATFNFSGPRLAPVADHVSASVDHVERPLMTADEVLRIRPPKKQGHGAHERIVAPGDMLIFVSGTFPIYGKQILYFTDPTLAQRAAIPPPTKFEALESGKVVAQKPHDRTVNVISRVESCGFIEELTLEHHERSE
ncbi:MAG: type IV secretory system conjugative DNA transfer family protein [Gemmatimonadaceae bacterium]|nr:type IV secretory system conjugative DNA transfer family protein [Gemmatimonadaceae bacterium]